MLLPGGRFRSTDAARLARWLDDLAGLGPPDQRPKRSAFGLSAEQFEQVHDDLAQRVGFSTQGVRRAQVVEKIGNRLRLPLRTEPGSAQAMRDDDLVAEELSSLSCAGGQVYVADKEKHAVYCLDAETGKQKWSYLTGGKVDSPPSISGGIAVFVCADGWAYALRASG